MLARRLSSRPSDAAQEQELHVGSAEIHVGVSWDEDESALRAAMLQFPDALMGVASRAAQVLEWDRAHRFCGVCGTPTELQPGERARAGLFLAMQYPVEIPGVSVSNFLRTAKTAISGEAPALRTWIKDVRGAMDSLKMDSTFTERNVNEGFSGGEKKRHEILQLELLKPKFAVLDETDSGLDVDALKVVSEGVNRAKEANDFGLLLITHYTRILKYIKPDFVHVFVAGKIAEQGGPELADRLEAEGYDRYVKA